MLLSIIGLRFEKLCEVQSDKASVEITSPYDGILRKVCHQVGVIVAVGETLCEIEIKNKNNANNNFASSTSPDFHNNYNNNRNSNSNNADKSNDDFSSSMNQRNESVACSPAVRRLAREHNIQLSDVVSSGPKGRVLKEDVMKYVNGASNYNANNNDNDKSNRTETLISSESSVSISNSNNNDIVVPLRGYDRAMAKAMMRANAEVPQLLFCEDIEMDQLIDARNTIRKYIDNSFYNNGNNKEENVVKMTYMPFIMKALSVALKQYPRMNAQVR